jgi:hypothetical protein
VAGALDHQVGIAAESTYGTPVTVTRFYEWNPDSKHQWDPRVQTGTGLRVGSRFARADRRVSVVGMGNGTITTDVFDKGMGVLLNAAMGNGASTLVSGTTFQQLFTSTLTSSLIPPLTIQYGVVRSDTAGTVDAYTYAGGSITKFELSCDSAGFLTSSFDWDAASLATGTALATASYPTNTAAFHFGQGAMTVGGAVTNPTTTALATGGTAATNIRNFTLSVDNNLDTGRWRFGGRNQPRTGVPKATIKATAEYDAVTWRDLLINQTTTSVTLTFTDTSISLSTGNAQFQIVAPACKVNPGAFAQPSPDTVTADVEFEVMEPSTGSALYLVIRTADSTL